MKSFYVIIFLFLFKTTTGFCQSNNFERLGTQEGLPQSSIYSLLQCHLGYIWFSSENGFFRYDGYSFKEYQLSNYIYKNMMARFPSKLFVDSKNRIWLFSLNRGISVFDPQIKRLQEIYIAGDTLSSEKCSNVLDIIEDSQLGIIIATADGLYRFDELREHFDEWTDANGIPRLKGIRLSKFTSSEDGLMYISSDHGLFWLNEARNRVINLNEFPLRGALNSDNLKRCFVDSKSRVWIGGVDDGGDVVWYDKKSNTYNIYSYLFDVDKYGDDRAINDIYEHNDGTIWVASNAGLYSFPNGNFRSKPVNWLAHLNISQKDYKQYVTKIFKDSNNNLWFATTSLGILKYDTQSDQMYRYAHDKESIGSPISDNVQDIFEDSKGIVWFSHIKGGISKYDLFRKKFKTLDYNSFQKHNIFRDTYGLSTDSRGDLWMGTGQGLYLIHEPFSAFPSVKKIPLSNSSGSIVGTLRNSENGKIWIGFFDDQLSSYDPKTQEIRNYRFHQGDSIRTWSIRGIEESQDGKIWFGGIYGKLSYYDPTEKRFQTLSIGNRLLPYAQQNNSNVESIHDILIQSDSIIWMGTVRNGLIMYNRHTNEIKSYKVKEGNSIAANEINVIFNDSDSVLWLGTNLAGISRLNLATQQFENFSTSDGLCNNVVYGILKDDSGDYWISTANGLSRFNYMTKRFINYNENDGIAHNEFNRNSFLKDQKGRFYFGGTNGITFFEPDSIKANPFSSNVHISGLRIQNRSIEIGDTINEAVVLSKAIDYTDQIELRHHQNDFTIEFTALHFSNSDKIEYRYMLEGFDKEWKYTFASNRMASYTALPAKDYRFVVYATNSDGVWSETPDVMNILISPPWWKTGAFFIIVMIFLFSCFVLLDYYRTRTITQKNKLLEQMVTERTHHLNEVRVVLEKQNGQLERQNQEIEKMALRLHESDEMKIKFFVNISHELKTPLTLILNSLEKLFTLENTPVWDMSGKYILMMNRNAQRLLRLFNQLIDFRRLDNEAITFHPEQGDVEDFLSHIIEMFRSVAEKRDIELNYESTITKRSHCFDYEIIEKTAFNLLSNAFKFTPNNGEVTVSLYEDEALKQLVIVVQDTGMGIREEEIKKIFDRFYTGTHFKEGQYGGTGVGLSLCKELIDLHQGTISVRSKVGEGTRFEVRIPSDLKEVKSEAKLPAYGQSQLLEENREVDVGKLPIDHSYEKDTHAIHKYSVVLVEDNPDLNELFCEELRTTFKVYNYFDGKLGYEGICEHKPDIVLLDVMLPTMSGFEICEKIKHNENIGHTPVVLLTALTAESSQKEGLKFGADDYISKPVRLDILNMKLQNIVQSRESWLTYFKQNPLKSINEIEEQHATDGFMRKVVSVIMEHLADSEFDGKALAEEVGVGKSTLYNRIKAQTGISVNIFIRNVRLNHAIQLFQRGHSNIKEVCYSSGFKELSYFSSSFKKMTGKSPREYMGRTES